MAVTVPLKVGTGTIRVLASTDTLSVDGVAQRSANTLTLGTTNTSTLNLVTTTGASSINIGSTTAAAQTINIGSTTTGVSTVNIGTSATGASVINLGNTTTTLNVRGTMAVVSMASFNGHTVIGDDLADDLTINAGIRGNFPFRKDEDHNLIVQTSTVGVGGAISVIAGTGFTANAGGAVALTGGTGATTGGGGAITILGGAAPGAGTGGTITITGGNSLSGTPGSISLVSPRNPTSQGAAVTITQNTVPAGIFVGPASPSGSISSTAGSLYLQTTGGVLWVNTGTTTWSQAASVASTTLQAAYNQTSGNTIEVAAAKGLSFANAVDDTNLLTLNRTFAGAGAGLLVAMKASTTGAGISVMTTAGATGDSLSVTNNGSGYALRVYDGALSIFEIGPNGNVNLWAGDNGTAGMPVNIYAGNGLSSSGGVLTLAAGNGIGGVGGSTYIYGGEGNTTFNGGSASITAGGAGASSTGGIAILSGGPASISGGTGGSARLIGGTVSAGAGQGGAVLVQGGSISGTGTGNSGTVLLAGGDADVGNGSGGNIVLRGGQAWGSGAGGGVNISTGTSSTGTQGHLTIISDSYASISTATALNIDSGAASSWATSAGNLSFSGIGVVVNATSASQVSLQVDGVTKLAVGSLGSVSVTPSLNTNFSVTTTGSGSYNLTSAANSSVATSSGNLSITGGAQLTLSSLTGNLNIYPGAGLNILPSTFTNIVSTTYSSIISGTTCLVSAATGYDLTFSGRGTSLTFNQATATTLANFPTAITSVVGAANSNRINPIIIIPVYIQSTSLTATLFASVYLISGTTYSTASSCHIANNTASTTTVTMSNASTGAAVTNATWTQALSASGSAVVCPGVITVPATGFYRFGVTRVAAGFTTISGLRLVPS